MKPNISKFLRSTCASQPEIPRAKIYIPTGMTQRTVQKLQRNGLGEKNYLHFGMTNGKSVAVNQRSPLSLGEFEKFCVEEWAKWRNQNV